MPGRKFHAMGGSVEVQLIDEGSSDFERIVGLFEKYEQTLSRFLPWSELEKLNAAAPMPFQASGILFDAVAACIQWSQRTRGMFNPAVRDALEACGYDRTFEEVAQVSIGTPTPHRTQCEDSWRNIDLHAQTRTITLQSGLRLDLGGIGKGFAVDRAIAGLSSKNAMINASGDLYASGNGPDGAGWIVGVQNPFDAERDIATIRVRNRGVATSGSTGRCWTRGDFRYHHLIDPRTGQSAKSVIATATVVASNATQADVLAKTAFLAGPREGIALIERFGASALLVSVVGDVFESARWKDYAS